MQFIKDNKEHVINCESQYHLCFANKGHNEERYRDLEAQFREAVYVDEKVRSTLIVDRFIEVHDSNSSEWADTPVFMMAGILFGTRIVSFFKTRNSSPNVWIEGLGIGGCYDDRNVLKFRRILPSDTPMCIYVVNENNKHIDPVVSIEIDEIDSEDDL